MRRQRIVLLIGCSVCIFFGTTEQVFSWGSTAHKIINREAVIHLPASMSSFAGDSLFFEAHASDADNRKNNSDTSLYAEAGRHYIDINDYPNFHSLSHDLQIVIEQYGWDKVKSEGVNPWAVVWALDSLTAQLKRGDTADAKQSASDLGHYVGDEHQPLHCTVNYNPGGLHSRYESTMINLFQSSITIIKDHVSYISSPIDYVFTTVYVSNSYVDDLIQADGYAKTTSGWSGSGSAPPAYYDTLWAHCQSLTISQIQRATVALASLWYTAYVNAGLITLVDENDMPVSTILYPNYPNPFNPATVISYSLANRGFVSLRIYDLLGREVATLVNEQVEPGNHTIEWNAANKPSGVYVYRLQSGDSKGNGSIPARKMILVK